MPFGRGDWVSGRLKDCSDPNISVRSNNQATIVRGRLKHSKLQQFSPLSLRERVRVRVASPKACFCLSGRAGCSSSNTRNPCQTACNLPSLRACPVLDTGVRVVSHRFVFIRPHQLPSGRLKAFMLGHCRQPAGRRLKLHLAALQRHGHLGGARFGELGAALGI